MRVLLVNQAFAPDTVSSGQHAADLAEGLVRAGHEVTVVTGSRAYDDPSRRFAVREDWRGVRVIRISSSGFGKSARWRRALDFGTFIANCCFRLLLLPRFDVTIAMTSPPLLGAVAAAVVRAKGGHLVSWVLDLNPDEAIAAGWLSETSVPGQFLESLLRFALRVSDRIFVMDRFMAARVAGRGIAAEKLSVVPPWSHSENVTFDAEGREAFRQQHGLADKFVVMYSGNHSPCHPLDSLLDAALRLRDDAGVAFVFVGGGSEFARVGEFAETHRLTNVLRLPYQPLESLSASLSAADLHAVVMGEDFVGIVHTCKVYNILALGVPFIYIGPDRSHIMDLASAGTAAVWMHHAPQGNVDRVVQIIAQVREAGPWPRPWEQAASKGFTQESLMPRMVREIEAVVSGVPVAGRPLPSAEGEISAGPEVIDSVLRDLQKRGR